MAEPEPNRRSRRAEETVAATPATSAPRPAAGRSSAGETVDARDTGRTASRLFRRRQDANQNAPQTIAVGQRGLSARPSAPPAPPPAPPAPIPAHRPETQPLAQPLPPDAAVSRRPVPPWAILLLGALALVAIIVVTFAFMTVHDMNRGPAASLQLVRLGAGLDVDTARAAKGGDATLQAASASFFACAEYRHAKQDAIYTFNLISGNSGSFDPGAVIAHGNFPGPAGAYSGCTTVQFLSGGRPSPGVYTLWLVPDQSDGATSPLGRLLLTFK